jgi:4-hydroxybenzoate polyprenyltransferase
MCAGALGLIYGFDLWSDSRRLQWPKSGKAGIWMLSVSLVVAIQAWWELREYLDVSWYAWHGAIVLLVAGYFALIVIPEKSKWKSLRELMAALVFSLVLIAGPAALRGNLNLTHTLLFFGTVFANLLAFSWLDLDKDNQYGMEGIFSSRMMSVEPTTRKRALFVWVLLLPPALVWYVFYAADERNKELILLLGVYLLIVFVCWLITEVHRGERFRFLVRLLADASLLLWLLP